MKSTFSPLLQIVRYLVAVALLFPILFVEEYICGFGECSLRTYFFLDVFAFFSHFLYSSNLDHNPTFLLLTLRALWCVSIVTVVINLVRLRFKSPVAIFSLLYILGMLLFVVGYHFAVA